MWKSSDYCNFSSSWTCNHDPSFIASYTMCTEDNDWNPLESDVSSNLVGQSPLTFIQETSSQSHLELHCSCKPQFSFTIIGVEIISEARTVECYSTRDGYLKTCKGREVKSEERATSAGETTLYAVSVKFDDPVSDLQIKFMGTVSRSEMKCYRLDCKVLQNLNGKASINSQGQVDMSKVRGYLHSMGDHVSPQAVHLMESVEQFQSRQMSGIGQLFSILGTSNAMSSGQDGASVLTSLLSMVSARSHDLNPANQSRDNQGIGQSKSSTHSSTPPEGYKPSPVEAMVQKVKDTRSEGIRNGDLDLYSMLQGICSKVSALRVTQNPDSTTPEVELNTPEADLEGNENRLGCEEKVDGVKHEMTLEVEQMVSKIVRESEERLTKYVDSRLSELENRLCARFEAILISLTTNMD